MTKCQIDPTDGYCHAHQAMTCTAESLAPIGDNIVQDTTEVTLGRILSLPVARRMWIADGRDLRA